MAALPMRQGNPLGRSVVHHAFGHRLAVAILALSLTVSVSGTAGAQSPSPATYPVAPDPAECVVAPASVDEIATILGTPDDTLAASPTAFVVPAGETADAETAAEVTATLRQVFACANAGDPLRFASLFTDDFVRDFIGGVPLDDVLGFLSAPPQPLPEDQKRVIIRFGVVQLLPDGRAGRVIVLDEPDDPRAEEPDYAILEHVDGRWLVDEIHEDGGAAATPASGTPVA